MRRRPKKQNRLTRLTRVTVKNGKAPRGRTDWAKLDAMSDAQARAAASADPDAPPLTPKELSPAARHDAGGVRAGIPPAALDAARLGAAAQHARRAGARAVACNRARSQGDETAAGGAGGV